MCICNEKAHVHSTQILVAPDAGKVNQLTVYSNEVETDSKNNMMLLPVPYPESVKFVDLSSYATIFDDLNHAFHRVAWSLSSGPKPKCLKVVEVGSYLASLAMNVEELSNLDQETFGTVNDEIKDLLKTNYGKGIPFGFVVCKLKAGPKTKYHPFAYSHKMPGDIFGNPFLFVPTRHEHGDEKEDPHWDHAIYSLNSNWEAGLEAETQLDLKPIPGFDLGDIFTAHKLTVLGQKPNQDLFFNLKC